MLSVPGLGSILRQRTKILKVLCCGQRKKKVLLITSQDCSCPGGNVTGRAYGLRSGLALRMLRMEPTALFINWCPWSLKGVRFSFHIHPGGQWGLSSRWFIHSADIHWVPTTCQALLGGGDREALLFQSLYSNPLSFGATDIFKNVWKWWTLFPENQWVNLSSTHTYTHGCSRAHSCCGVRENPAHWISSTISWVQKAYSSSLPSGGLCLLPTPPPVHCSGLPLSTLCCFG